MKQLFLLLAYMWVYHLKASFMMLFIRNIEKNSQGIEVYIVGQLNV